jgi:hypothetical protein
MASNRAECGGCKREIGGRGNASGLGTQSPLGPICADCRRRMKLHGAIPEGGFPKHQTVGDLKRLWIKAPFVPQ